MVAPLIAAAGRVVAKKSASDRVKEMAERRVREYGRMQANLSGERPSFILYSIVTVFAFLKDLTDLIFGLMPIPGLGTVMAIIFGFCISTTIYLLLTAFDRSGNAKNLGSSQAFVKRLLVLLGAMIVDIVPFLNFLPITTISVLFLYSMARREWKKGNGGSILRFA